MKKRGQMGLGIVIVAFIGIIAALALYQGMIPFIDTATITNSMVNQTLTNGTVGTAVDLQGQDVIGTPVVWLQNDSALVEGVEFTIDEDVSETTGVKTIQYTPLTATGAESVNVTYDYGADGYVDSAGGRSIALLIPLLSALAIAVLAIVPSLRSGLVNAIKGR